MKSGIFPAVLSLATIVITVTHTIAADPPADEKDVLNLLHCDEFSQRQKLVSWGDKAFFIYVSLLEDERTDPEDVSRIFCVLTDVKGDRSEFLKHAVKRLADKQTKVRATALDLLAQIGTQKETKSLVGLLPDNDAVIVHFAAKALGAVGGPPGLLALDAWLLGDNHANDVKLREHVKRYRDELAARLAKEPKKK